VEFEIPPRRAQNELFEGDMKLTDDQLAEMKAAELGNGNDYFEGIQENAIRNTDKRWPDNTIKYELHSYLSDDDAALVRDTLQNLTTKTGGCLHFVESKSSSEHRVLVTDDADGGCGSYVGYVPHNNHMDQNNTQYLNLARETSAWWHGHCMHAGVIEHEFLHTAGIYHTQGRSDRDQYVEIIDANIRPDKKNQFKKYNKEKVRHYNLPYDYDSVMHYGGKAFTKNRKRTIRTLDPSKQNVIGQRHGVSEGDIALVRKMYGCEATMPVTTTTRPKTSTTTQKTTDCKEDVSPLCAFIKKTGGCTISWISQWATNNCYKSCVGCKDDSPYTDNPMCSIWVEQSYGCYFPGSWVAKNCQKSCKEQTSTQNTSSP